MAISNHLFTYYTTLREYLLSQSESIPLDEALEDWLSNLIANKLDDYGEAIMGNPERLSSEERRYFEQIGNWLSNQINQVSENKMERKRQAEQIEQLWLNPPKSLKRLQKMDPGKFEYWVAGYFKKHGYQNIIVTQLSGDFGIDIYMKTPGRLPAVVQCKRYGGVVGRPVVQQTYGAMRLVRARRCYVVTTGRFAATARELENEHKDIKLLDGMELISSSRISTLNSFDK